MVSHKASKNNNKFDQAGVLLLAKVTGWTLVQDCDDTAEILSFCRDDDRLTVYCDTTTVSCCADHPTMGKKRLFYKNVKWASLMKLFDKMEPLAKKAFCRITDDEFNQPEPLLKSRGFWANVQIGNEMQEVNANADSMPIVAMGKTFFLCDCFGDTFWGSGDIPERLFGLLQARDEWSPHIEVIAFGPNDSYFVLFADGEYQSRNFPEQLKSKIRGKKSSSYTAVKSLALGPNGSYFCLWADGDTKWYNLPELMKKELSREGEVVEEVTMGPNGEWFIRFESGDWRCHGHTPGCDSCIAKIEKIKKKNIVQIVFGQDKSWLITYE